MCNLTGCVTWEKTRKIEGIIRRGFKRGSKSDVQLKEWAMARLISRYRDFKPWTIWCWRGLDPWSFHKVTTNLTLRNRASWTRIRRCMLFSAAHRWRWNNTISSTWECCKKAFWEKTDLRVHSRIATSRFTCQAYFSRHCCVLIISLEYHCTFPSMHKKTVRPFTFEWWTWLTSASSSRLWQMLML
jgi:hypothetical protein